MKIYQRAFKDALALAKSNGHRIDVFDCRYRNDKQYYSWELRVTICPYTKLVYVAHAENGNRFYKTFGNFKEAKNHCNLLISDFFSILKEKNCFIQKKLY
jgi:hypothetical protein